MKILLLLLSLLSLSLAFSPEKHQVLGWERVGEAEREENVKFYVYLKQSNLGYLENLFWEVSDPLSKQYGHYLNNDEITEIVSPSSDDITSVVDWLSKNSVTSAELVANKDVLVVSAKAKVVEKLFDVKLSTFRHKSGKKIIRSNTMYSLPDHLTPVVDFVLGVSNFPKVNPRARTVPRMNAEQGALINSTSPIIEFISGVSEKLTVYYVPVCLYSSNVSTTVPPCMDSPPVSNGAAAWASSISSAVNTTYYGFYDALCNNASGITVCELTIPVHNYVLFNVSIQQSYDSGDSSTMGYYDYPAMASPALTPESIKSYYNIPVSERVTQANVTQAVGEFEQQYYSDSDLQYFFREMGLPSTTPVYVVGPNNVTDPGVEANLDIQYIMGIGTGAPTTFWSIYANSTIEIDDILQWATAMSNTQNPPIVNSLSYGMTEDAVDLFLGKGYLNRSDVEFQKLALRGVTIIIADGDAGAGDLGPPPMSADTCMPLHADWPSQSPYVTAVSATMFTPLAEPICYLSAAQGGIDCSDGPLGEVPTSVELGTPWTTGGGFSNTSSQPSYQADFVKQYLATLTNYDRLPPQGYFNPFGRAYPDVSMVGHNLMVAVSGSFMTVDGTSAAAPVFAGFVTLLNNRRVQNGKPLLGFLNPILYQIARDYPDAYNDVVVGSNRCGDVGFEPTCCPYGYDAVSGFDAVTGLGSPDFGVFKDVILAY